MANTGLPDALVPTSVTTGCNLGTPNQVYSAKLFDCSTAAGLRVTAPGVVIQDSLVYCGLYFGVVVYPGASLTIRHSSFRAKGGNWFARECAVSGGGVTATDIKVRSVQDGVYIDGNNWEIRDSVFVSDPAAGGCTGCHADGIQLYNGGAGFRSYGSTYVVVGASTAALNWSGSTGAAPLLDGNTFVEPVQLSFKFGGNSGWGATVVNNRIAGNVLMEQPACSKVAAWSGNEKVTLSADYGTVLTRSAFALVC